MALGTQFLMIMLIVTTRTRSVSKEQTKVNNDPPKINMEEL